MKSHEKVRAEIEAKLAQLDQTINELKQRATHQNETFKALERRSIEELEEKKRQAENKLNAFAQADEAHHESLSSDLKNFMGDIDDQLRKALAFYK